MTKVIKFWAEWCGPCVQSAPIVEAAAKEAGVPLISVNIEDDVDGLAAKYKIKSLPTLIVVEDDKEVLRLNGKRTYEDYLSWFKLAAKGNEPQS